MSDVFPAVVRQVVSLMGTDLVRYKDRWAQGVKEMREVFVRLEGEYPRDSQQVRGGRPGYQGAPKGARGRVPTPAP